MSLFNIKNIIFPQKVETETQYCEFYSNDEVKIMLNTLKEEYPSMWATLDDVMNTNFTEIDDMIVSTEFPNLMIPKKYIFDYDESYFPDILNCQKLRNSDDIYEKIKTIFPEERILHNQSNYVLTKNMDCKTYFTSPIALESDKVMEKNQIKNPGNFFFSPVFGPVQEKIKSTSFPLKIQEYTKDSKALFNYDITAKACDREFYVTQVIDEMLSTRTVVDTEYTYDLSWIFAANQESIIDFPFPLPPLACALLNRTVTIGCVFKTWMSLRQKLSYMHSISEKKKIQEGQNPEEIKKEEYQAVLDDYKLMKKIKAQEDMLSYQWKMPNGTVYMKQSFGLFDVYMTSEPHSESVHWTIVRDNVIIQRCIQKENKIEEMLRNSVLSFIYSLMLNEACAEFPAYFLYMLNPTPEYANELSILWMQQQSMIGVKEKAMSIIEKKLEYNVIDSMQAMKRAASLMRLYSMSSDVLFIETSMTRPVLKSEKYSFKAICKFFKQPEPIVFQRMKTVDHWAKQLPAVMTDKISSKDFHPEDVKVDAASFASQSSSAITDIEKEIARTIVLGRYKPMSSGGAMLALTQNDVVRFEKELNELRELAYEDFLGNKIDEMMDKWETSKFTEYVHALYKRLCNTDIPETHLLNLFLNAENTPIFISLFVKDQTQGVREISVLNAVGKLVTQFAESLVRPLSHEMKESLILDTKDRATALKTALTAVNENKIDGEIVCINGDYTAFNSYVQLPIMTSVVAEAMKHAGYSASSIESYIECMLSYEEKNVQIKLSDIWDHWQAWKYAEKNCGYYANLEKRLIIQAEKKRSQKKTDFLIEKIKKKTALYNSEIIPVIREKFEEVYNSIVNNKLTPEDEKNIIMYIDWPYGMSQGICGTSATIFCVLINRFFFKNSQMIRKGHNGQPNVQFVQTSDDVKVFVNLEDKAFVHKFIEKWDAFSNVFGMKLSLEKTDADVAERIIFNSNVWNITVKDSELEKKEYEKLFGVPDDEVTPLISPCIDQEEKHLGRILKPLFMDQLAVDANLEWSSFVMSLQIICPSRHILNTQWVQTLHAFSMYLTRLTYLFYNTMKDLEPEWSNIPVVKKNIQNSIIWMPQITKAIRGSYKGMRTSRTQGVELINPTYKNSARKEQYLKTLSSVIGEDSVSIEKMASVEFAATIMNGGMRENRSIRLLVYSLYRAHAFDYNTGLTVHPSKLKFYGRVNDKIMSFLYCMKSLEFQKEFRGMQFIDTDSRETSVAINTTTVKYLLEKEDRIDVNQYIKTTKFVDAAKLSVVPIPYGEIVTQFLPHRYPTGHSIISSVFDDTPVCPWVIPQLSNGTTWYKEGLHITILEKLTMEFVIFTFVNNKTISRIEIKIKNKKTGEQVRKSSGMYITKAQQFLAHQFDFDKFSFSEEQNPISAELLALKVKGPWLIDTRPGHHNKTRRYSDKVTQLSKYRNQMLEDAGVYIPTLYEPEEPGAHDLEE